MDYFLAAVAGLHLLFMVAELLPWRLPMALKAASKPLHPEARFTEDQLKLVSMIVHNAGIYNGIVAGGLLWAAFPTNNGYDVARVMLIGAIVAGIFGTITLKSWPTALQAVAGIICLFRIWV